MSRQPETVKKVCILGASFNTGNLGVSVLAEGALQWASRWFPQSEIIQCDYACQGSNFQFTCETKSLPIRLINIRFSKRLWLPNHIGLLILLVVLSKAVPFRPLRRALCHRNRYLAELYTTDIFLSVAGGDSFSDLYGLRRLLYISLPQILVLLMGKRLVLLPQSIGPFSRTLSKAIASYILANADAIYSRERLAPDARLPGAKDGTLQFCPDLGFDLTPVRPSSFETLRLFREGAQKAPMVGVNVSGLLMMGGYNHRNAFGLTVAYDHLIHRLLDYFIGERGAAVLLIPHVSGSSAENDYSACERIFAEAQEKYSGKIDILPRGYDHREVKYCIGKCEFFAGARMHACIGALSQSVPAISLAYSNKFSRVMDTIGCRELVADLRRMSESEILRLVDSVYSRRDTVRLELSAQMAAVRWAIRHA